MLCRRDLAKAVGGFRSEFDVSQDHDFLLRVSRVAESILHIPRILYHWRTTLKSMSRASNSEERVLSSSRGVIERFLNESETGAQVEQGAYPGRWRVRYPIPAGTHVSILIPSAGKIEVLNRNLDSLWERAGQTSYEVVIIDNSKGSNNAYLVRYVDQLRAQGRAIRRFDQRNEPFNYSLLNNRAAETCDSSLLLFLNDDTEGISSGWLDALAELAPQGGGRGGCKAPVSRWNDPTCRGNHGSCGNLRPLVQGRSRRPTPLLRFSRPDSQRECRDGCMRHDAGRGFPRSWGLRRERLSNRL